MLLTQILFLASGAAALGINCRGSGFCEIGIPGALQHVREQVGSLIVEKGGDTSFSEGQQIACDVSSQGNFCAFYQNGASGTAQDAYDQLQGLLDHGCTVCGSIPTNDGNNVDDGELTVNYVSDPCCEGQCYC